MKILLLIFTTITIASAWPSTKRFASYHCTVLEGQFDYVHCTHQKRGDFFYVKINPLEQNIIANKMKDEDAYFVSQEKYTAYITNGGLTQLLNLSINDNSASCNDQLIKTTYQVNTFQNEKTHFSMEAKKALNHMAHILNESGICQDEVTQNSKYGIYDSNTLLEHFLCLANYESTLGKNNISKNKRYRGPFMISKNHGNKGKICEGIKYFKDSNKDYTTEESEAGLANAKCALLIYKNQGLSPWGAHKKCTIHRKKQFNFLNHLDDKYLCQKKPAI